MQRLHKYNPKNVDSDSSWKCYVCNNEIFFERFKTHTDVDDNMAPILVERGFFLVKISVKPNNHFRLNLDLKTSLSLEAAQFPILDAW